MTNARLTHYQGLLLDAPHILFSEPVSLNPATLLPNPDLEAPLHDCQEIIAEITQVRPDLQDSALPNSELVWYTDGSSFISDGVRKAGTAVVDQGGNIIWRPRWDRRRLTVSGLGSITPTCVKPVSKNRKTLESGLHGGTQITH
jgi:hypothetical protein